MFTLDLQGLPAFTAAFQRLATQAQQAMVEAVQQEAEQILEASSPLVPIDTGLLLSTGLVIAQHDGAEISYGGKGLAPYAARIEFDTSLNHPNGGQHHYLSAAVFAAVDTMPQRLAARVASRLLG